MNRRELIAGAAAVVVAAPAVSQTMDSSVSYCHAVGQNLVCDVPPSLEERNRQYAICKDRGHVAEISLGVTFAAVYNADQSSWSTCKYCRTQFRYVTTMEEANKPI